MLLNSNPGRIFFSFTITLLVLGLLFWKTSNLHGQSTGLKYFKNYSRQEYGGHNQNWAVLQDKRGIIYVANHSGLKEFDGISWRQISVPNFVVRSMAMDNTGTIYVGGRDEIGFLAPDSDGTLHYVSLLEHLDDSERNFGNVGRIHSTKGGIYFRTSKFIFRWNPNSKDIKICKPDKPGDSFKASFICKEKLFIRQENVGLMKMDIGTDWLIRVPGGDAFAKKKIYMMAPYEKNVMLMGTRENGFYKYDGSKAVPFTTGADNYLKEKKLSHGIRLSSGDFALATLFGGLVIIDSRGKLKEIFNKAYGLQDDYVNYVFEDFQGNLWLAMNQGISKIEYASPFSFYDDRSNLHGLVQSVVKHGKYLYAGTDKGLYSLASSQRFRLAAGISSNCWSLLSIAGSLLTATTDGVFQVENDDKRRVIENRSYVLFHSPKETNRVWVGTRQGLVSLYCKDSKWTEERKFKNITLDIETLVEDKKGNLWLGTQTRGVLKVDLSDNKENDNPVVTQYYTSHGLPTGWVRVFMAAGHVMFATNKGIYRFDESKKIFIPDFTLGEEFAGAPQGKWTFCIMEDKNKNIWLYSEAGIIQVIPRTDQTFFLNKKPFLGIPKTQVNTIYPDPDGNITWFACNDGLFRYDTRVKKNYNLDFSTFIRKVLVNKELVFDGYQHKEFFPVIDYKDRNLRFEFAAPFFEAETRIQYQCFLEGYEKDWSAFSSETWKDYTNLDNGIYTFRVRAQNVYENLSKEAVFKFRILPPWTKTWWAYLFYAIAIFWAVFFIVKWRSGKLEREKQKLEQIVKERTTEIEDKNLQLEKKTAQLEEQSEKLKELDKVKSRFFANISHEFRTPLTLIMGPLEQIISKTADKDQEKQLNLMLRNSQRLLSLINQLLELSKFDSGQMKFQASQQNIIPFLKGIVASFEPVTAKNELDLTFHAEEENITLYFDAEKLEEVLFNLLSNAVKFTPAGGIITVAAARTGTEQESFPSGSLEVLVCDTGPGIARDQLVHIFDRFYQSDSTYEHHQKGSGIGLAIAKEIVDLHHGKINVHSHEGKGTEFIIRLPLGDAHLKPEEIVEPLEIPYQHKNPGEIPGLYMMDKQKGIPVEDKSIPTDGKVGTEDGGETLVTEKNIILVVEDSTDVRDYIRGSLEPLYEVVDAKDGREGMQKAQKIIPDLIISDIMMPKVDGYELCRQLKNDVRTSHIPIILLTAKASEENIIRGLETGADDYITKPFNTKILCARIKNMIDLRRQLQLKLKRQMRLQPAEISVTSFDEEFYKELEAVIEKNLSDSEFNVEQLGKKLYLSRATLYRKIMALTGEPPYQFIRSYRLKRAAQLLKANFGNVTEVAIEVGFTNMAYFTQCFKEEFHQLPSTYQASESEPPAARGT
ncbi:MAG: response regulator [Candidatus Aminicenantes bacterium]|jgi:signal transduction histidine kinase/DNA-binding response OmpR family regulator/ligand-binding sensor domain-containing protein